VLILLNMKNKTLLIGIFIWGIAPFLSAQPLNEAPGFATSQALQILKTSVKYDAQLSQFIFSIQVKGQAGTTRPEKSGNLDGAPVLGYVFPTSLKPEQVGFSSTEGILALALTSHPDFDDTPLWDENGNARYGDDGLVWHPHWVVLVEDNRVPGGLSVKQFDPEQDSVKLPPTNPGMPMYMDSPGYPVITRGNQIQVIVPAYRMQNITDFSFDAVSAYMQVNTSVPDKPMLGVYAVYSVASGDLSLPYKVQ